MHVRCSYCRHSFNLGRDYLINAVAEATEKRQKYHGIECPNCRKLIKIPLRQMKRFTPRVRPETEGGEE
jgi:DNA-directed RNA polymerase subunit RPC12/RpoP